MPLPITPRLTPAQITTLLGQIGTAVTNRNINQAINAVDTFHGNGNNNGVIDAQHELETLAEILSARVTDPQQLANQRQILLNLNQLIPDQNKRTQLFTLIANNHARNNPTQNSILIAQDAWSLNNIREVIGVGNRHQLAGRLHEAGRAIPQERLNGLAGWRANTRQMLHGAWNNDGQGTQFISNAETIAMYAEAKRQCQAERGAAFNEAEFNREFSQLFMTSVREDTNFNPQLIASQVSMTLTRCKFMGEGSEGFTPFLQALNTTLWGEAGRGQQPGTILYTDRSSNPSHGSMVVFINAAGNIQVEFIPPTEGITFDFGRQGGANNNLGLGNPPAPPPPPVPPVPPPLPAP